MQKNQQKKKQLTAVPIVVNKIGMEKILVLCTGNSCRSQIAEGYLRKFAGDKAEVYSASVETHVVNPNNIQILK